jgi:hypothetical protein
MYEYKCRDCGVIFSCLMAEEYRTAGCKCPNCQGWGDYIISRPYFKQSIDSDAWVKKRQSHMKKEQKNMKEHGTYD